MATDNREIIPKNVTLDHEKVNKSQEPKENLEYYADPPMLKEAMERHKHTLESAR